MKINFLIKRHFFLKNPPQSNIIIFEKTGSRRIQNLILQDLPVFVFDSRLNEIFLGFQVIVSFFLNLNQFKIKSIKDYKTRLHGIVGQIWRIYILAVIKIINPKVVITLIDNHPIFHWLCKHYNGAEFIAIQNGNRTKGQLNQQKVEYTLQHYFCFGNYEKDLFSNFNYKVDKYYPVGSLLAGFYIDTQKMNNITEYDICLISAWRGDIGNTEDVKKTMKAMKKLDCMLSKYIEETKIKVSIIMRSEPGSSDRNIPVYGNERDYFHSIYPETVTLVDPDLKNFNIYSEILKGDLIISMGSTVPREAFGFGKKILYCDFTRSNLYNYYNSTILFKDKNYELFKQRIDELLIMPTSEYKKNTEKYASYLMNNDLKYPPHLIIRKTIDNYLGVTEK